MTDFTKWSPTCGCTPVNDGCTNCPGERAAWRLRNDAPYSFVASNEKWNGTILPHSKQLKKPLKRKKPTRYLIGTMGDPFHPGVEDEWLDRIFAVMALCPQHTFVVLTKRPERAREYLTNEGKNRARWDVVTSEAAYMQNKVHSGCYIEWPLPNVHIGVLVHDQPSADGLVPKLLEVPAAKRIVWVRPREEIYLMQYFIGLYGPNCERDCDAWENICTGYECPDWLQGLDFLVCDGETGPGAHPVHPDWFRSLRDQCADAGVAFRFEGWGEYHAVVGELADKWVHLNGQTFGPVEGEHFNPVETAYPVKRVGSKRSGRLLDAVEHDGWPE
jgi:protein gp37